MTGSRRKIKVHGVLIRNLIVLNQISDHENPREINLDWCDFYVQVTGLPLRKRHKNIAIHMANTLGKVKVESVRDGYMVYGHILRFRVSLNITKPLRRIMKLRIHDNGLMEVGFQYERLRNFCYYCWLMDHVTGVVNSNTISHKRRKKVILPMGYG